MKSILLRREDIHSGNLILVNQEYGYAEHTQADSIPVIEGADNILFNRKASVLLNRLMEEINGWESIVPVSGWRSEQEQQSIWDSSIAENGMEFTRTYVAFPGHSEHQTGYAIDLGLKQKEIDFIRPDFPYDGICQTFRGRMASYGFVERYLASKEEITKIGHEPWHFRYVGVPHAAIMEEHGMVLEEYLSFLRQFRYGANPYLFRRCCQEIMVSYMEFDDEVVELEVDDSLAYSVSGNNVDGFIITQWRKRDEF